MYPHERSLVEKYKDQPFALLGINSDPIATLKKAVTREKMTWRSWHDGPPNGPIANQWRVSAWPTMHIIDKKGNIRFRNVRSNLETMIDQLLAE
jgi:hypothetical protein